MITNYTGIKSLYFKRIIKKIIALGQLEKVDKILDFGCGEGQLKKMLGNKVVNYDILPKYSDVTSWKNRSYSVIVVNEVFYEIDESEVKKTLDDMKKCTKTIIAGIGRKSWLNRFGAWLLREKNAHTDYKTLPERELEILKEKLDVIKKTNVWGLCDIYLMKFR